MLRRGDAIFSGGVDAGPSPAAPATEERFTAPKPSPRDLPTIELRGVRFHAITEAECVDYILDGLDLGHGGMVVTPNLDHLHRCTKDLTFAALVSEADLVVADGMPLVWASRLQGTPLPERVAGSNLISSLSAAAASRGKSIFLLGGAPGTAEAATAILRQRSPNIQIVGSYCPPLGFESDQKVMSELIASLLKAKPDIVFVALGSPKQEMLIDRIRRVLPTAWWLGVGISFSFLCGNVKRAPKWMQHAGVEWVHRLAQEPTRLFRRYLFVGIPFGLSLISTSAIEGISRKLGKRRPAEFTADDSASSNGNGHAAAGNRDEHSGANNSTTTNMPAASPELRRHKNAGGNARIAPHWNTATGAPRSLDRLRGLILLGGSVRPTPLKSKIGRSVLDLPLDASGSILQHWLRHAEDVANLAGHENLPVRVLVNQNSPEPASVAPRPDGTFRVERDLSEFRGTGGVLGDLASSYEDDDLILVANAAQILLDPLRDVATALDATGGDVAVVAHEDGTPSGVMLLRCKTLRIIPKTGFVDMKEQALPIIASSFDVRVLDRVQPSGLPVRSLSDYVAAMRRYHRHRAGLTTTNDPLAEDWSPSFAIAEEGATVDPSARVHDSIVLKGGIVEAHAVVVRSVVCPQGVVRRDRHAVDQFVTAATDGAGAARAAVRSKVKA